MMMTIVLVSLLFSLPREMSAAAVCRNNPLDQMQCESRSPKAQSPNRCPEAFGPSKPEIQELDADGSGSISVEAALS